jgi:hypothetical protein
MQKRLGKEQLHIFGGTPPRPMMRNMAMAELR